MGRLTDLSLDLPNHLLVFRSVSTMRRSRSILALIGMLAFAVSSQPSSFDPLPVDHPVKWPGRTIQIAFSTSLLSPSPSIKPGSDVSGALRRALKSWSEAANISFIEVSSKAQSISRANAGDGINLVTIAATSENLAVFAEEDSTARTRVFYDSETGKISEADIVINPFPYSPDGALLQFSTDGTPGTYDLESTFAHELGHLLGLSHSPVIAATMQASQGLNGTYGLTAFTARTISDADRTAVRGLYGQPSREKTGSVEGRVLDSVEGSLLPASGAHVWFEDLASGRVMASSLTAADGRFKIDGVPAGDYRAMTEYLDDQSGSRQRPFRSVEISSQLRVTANKVTSLNYVLAPPQNSAPKLKPRLLGMNNDLSTVPVSAQAASSFRISVSGEGVDQIPVGGLLVSSPYITVNPGSVTLEQSPNSTPVISFEVTIATNAPAGDYSLRLQSNFGELAYLVGGITIDPSH